MAKRKITVTVDEELVDAVHEQGAESLSSVVNSALASEVDRLGRAAALKRLLDGWDAQFGPVDDAVAAEAAAVFDQLDALRPDSPAPTAARPTPRPRGRKRRSGAA